MPKLSRRWPNARPARPPTGRRCWPPGQTPSGRRNSGGWPRSKRSTPRGTTSAPTGCTCCSSRCCGCRSTCCVDPGASPWSWTGCCPPCGADTSRWPLAATKTGLACANCLPVPAVEPATPPESGVTGGLATVRKEESSSRSPRQSRAETPAPAASETQSRAKAAPPSRPTARPVPPALKKKRLSAQAVSAAGEKLAMELWSLTAQENLRALRRLCAEDSPAAAAIRLYGAAGPAVAAGLAPREALQSLTMTSESHGDGELAGTWGYLQTGRADYTYLLRWHAGTRLIAEILPFGNWVTARLPSP